MKCPVCNGKTKVYEHNIRTNKGYLRRRRCDDCGHRFRTLEVICDVQIQGDGKRGGKRVALKKLGLEIDEEE